MPNRADFENAVGRLLKLAEDSTKKGNYYNAGFLTDSVSVVGTSCDIILKYLQDKKYYGGNFDGIYDLIKDIKNALKKFRSLLDINTERNFDKIQSMAVILNKKAKELKAKLVQENLL